MNNRVSSNPSHLRPSATNPTSPNPASSPFIPPTRKVLSPGEWVRAVSGSDAPFGFDRMPTVFG
ncbi:hypothetical protein IAD21_05480 [Abditibacteriota bacterium]|nr:hypothetical protein IAD21_05480 [Abditibacteriota bacterium]